ncbi:helix-turn-helix domain-containing protein [Hungatella hathewayi]|uniref:helix-turn-helix domain-containing protein n=1 Tax=Hungatella hathewayi TaxID=154046 RepID=UPI0021A7E99C|nr:helix-turn-helix transcriptional regulator [Hungatella hathewayi]UWO83161.1 helix-turn-helix domain-containing protein [Hungatella hathewayi]
MDTNDINIIFSDNLNYWLERRGKTQADLYKKLNVSSATASDWSNGKKMPKADKLVQISKWLMIELSDLLEEKKPTNDTLNDIMFRLTDDENFRQAVEIIYNSNEEVFAKIFDYEKLLMK